MKNPKKSIWLAGAFTVLSLAVLLDLGLWQLQRLKWKTALLAQIDENLAAQPIPLPDDIDIKKWEYRKACTQGTFLHEREMYLFSTSLMGNPGYHVYTPFLQTTGAILIVNRGWVPNSRKDPMMRKEGQITTIMKICGVLRSSRTQGWFVPDNDLTNNQWYSANVDEMAKAIKLDNVLPFLLDANDAPNPGGYPIGGQTRVDIPNNHLGYAITWFGLAAALLGVFSIFVMSHLRGHRR